MADCSKRAGGSPKHSSHRLRISRVCIMFAAFALSLPGALAQNESLAVSEVEFNLLVNENKLFHLIQIGEYNQSLTVLLEPQYADIVQLFPPTVELPASEHVNGSAVHSYDVCALGKSPGHSEITFNVTPAGFIDAQRLVMRVTVMYSRELHWLSVVMGWVYFAAWSVSFYPQVWTNYRRRSVVGLNFDFLALNLLGFSMYSLFNCGLYFSKLVQDQYLERHPTGLNPVQLNDVFFSLHAAFATVITISQCFCYERAEQSVSLVGRAVLAVLSGVVVVSAVLVAAGAIVWLDFLYYCSYVKLCITIIKYLPQAYMNYARKSTVGWSIGNIFLDLVGGALSMLQMLLNAYNYDDWHSIFGDPTKFGLGLFSLIFDIFFIIQHYVFYRESGQFLFVASGDKELRMMEGSDKGALTSFYDWVPRYMSLSGDDVAVTSAEPPHAPDEQESLPEDERYQDT